MDYILRLANLLTLCTYHISLIQSILKHEKHQHEKRLEASFPVQPVIAF